MHIIVGLLRTYHFTSLQFGKVISHGAQNVPKWLFILHLFYDFECVTWKDNDQRQPNVIKWIYFPDRVCMLLWFSKCCISYQNLSIVMSLSCGITFLQKIIYFEPKSALWNMSPCFIMLNTKKTCLSKFCKVVCKWIQVFAQISVMNYRQWHDVQIHIKNIFVTIISHYTHFYLDYTDTNIAYWRQT